MENLIITQELEGLPESKALQIRAVYEPMIKMLEDFEGAYNELMAEEQTPEKCKRAKALRLKIARVRIDADKARKEHKRDALLTGRAIDGFCNTFILGIGNKEKELKEVENCYERQEEERVAKIQAEREAELAKYSVTIQTPDMLGRMTEDVWINCLNGVKLNWEAVKEAERKAEEERISVDRDNRIWHERRELLAPYAQFGTYDIATNTTQAEFDETLERLKAKKKEHEQEQARIKLENESLKAEQEKMLIEKNHREMDQRERDKQQARLLHKQKKQLFKEKQEREKLERERKEKEEQRKEAGRKRALAPDKEKLLYFADALEKKKDTVESQEAKTALSKAADVLKEEAARL